MVVVNEADQRIFLDCGLCEKPCGASVTPGAIGDAVEGERSVVIRHGGVENYGVVGEGVVAREVHACLRDGLAVRSVHDAGHLYVIRLGRLSRFRLGNHARGVRAVAACAEKRENRSREQDDIRINLSSKHKTSSGSFDFAALRSG